MMRPFPSPPLLLALIGIPVLLGIALAFTHSGVNTGAGETGQAALNLLREGFLGNPYLLPTGPTAHVSPVHSGYLAAVYFLFGENTAGARIVLSLVCTALWAASTYYVVRIGLGQKLGPVGIGVGVSLTCLMPLYLYLAVVGYRQWDQPFAALILTYSLHRVMRGEGNGSLRSVVAMAALAGLGALISPAILPTLLIGVWFALPPLAQPRKLGTAAVMAAVVVAAFLLPWGLRNAEQLGTFNLTRSNFGLELALGNNALSAGDSETANHDLHPFLSEPAARLAADIGEVAYMRRMSDLATGWIKDHPGEFIGLSVTRGLLTFVPSERMIAGWWPLIGAGFAWLYFTAFGLAKALGLLWVLFHGPRRMVWLAYTMLPLAPYLLTHVNTRYLFVVFFPSVCLIAYVADHAWNTVAARCRPGLLGRPG